MDRALDDVVREHSQDKRGSNSNGRRFRRNPRGGVRKTGRHDNYYNDSLAWVHDKYDGDSSFEPLRRAASSDIRHDSETIPAGAGKLRVDNIHYELGEDELLGLFERQGVVLKLELKYDRAGRSEGIAFVTYQREQDAKRAIDEFDGANANGQPIHLTLIPRHQNEGKSLFDRIRTPAEQASLTSSTASSALPRERRRRYTDSPERDSNRDPTRRPTPPNIDRYVPPERRRERPRSSEPAVGGGGRRRGGGGSGGGSRDDRTLYSAAGRRYNGATGSGTARASGGNRPRKTVEELDEEMNNYFTDAGAQEGGGGVVVEVAPLDEDEEMIL